MSWTYGADPANSDRDAVRLNIGDTDTTEELLQDAEIAYYLTTFGSVGEASYRAAQAISAKYARKSDQAIGDLKYSYSQQSKRYAELASELKQQYAVSGVGVYSGGRTIADKDTVEEDTDRVQPAFKRDQFANPKTGKVSSDKDAAWYNN